MTKRPLCVAGISALCVFAAVFPFQRPVWLAVGAACLVCWGVLLFFPRLGKGIRLAVLSGALVCLYGYGYYGVLTQPLLDQAGRTLPVTGMVLAAQSTTTRSSYEVRLERVGEAKAWSARMKLYDYREEREALEVGERFTTSVEILANQQQNGLSKGVPLSGFVQEGPVQTLSTTPFGMLCRFRERLSQSLLDLIPDQRGAIGVGILFGDKSGISQETTQLFRQSGLSHVLAVSGLHLTMLTLMVSFLLRRLPGRVGILLNGLVLLLFLAFELFSLSVMRAGMMALLVLAGKLAGRRADTWNCLGFAALVILLGCPYSAGDVGLQLSMSAVAGILLLSGPLQRLLSPRGAWWEKGRIRRYLCVVLQKICAILSVSAAASLGIAPVSLLQFGECSLLGMFTAIPVAVLVPVILSCSLVAPLFSLAGLSFLAGLVAAWDALAVWLLRLTAQWTAAIPVGVVYRWDLPVVGAVVLVVAALILIPGWFPREKGKRIAGYFLCFLGAVAVYSGSLWADKVPFLTFPDGESGYTAILYQYGQTGVMVRDCTDRTAQQILQDVAEHRRDRIDVVWLDGEDWLDLDCCRQLLEQIPVDVLLYPADHPDSETLASLGKPGMTVYAVGQEQVSLPGGWQCFQGQGQVLWRFCTGEVLCFWDGESPLIQGDWIVSGSAPKAIPPEGSTLILPETAGEGMSSRQTVLREEGTSHQQFLVT